MVEHVRHERPLAGAAKPVEAVLHVREEALPRLFTVVPYVNARLDLSGDARAGRTSNGGPHLIQINGLTTAAAAVHLRQLGWTGKAAGVGGEDAPVRRQHSPGAKGTPLPAVHRRMSR